MGRRKREPMDPANKNIVSELIKTYDIKTAKDIQEALKDLLGETLQDMLEAEMNEHLGYEKYSRDEDVVNSRNGYKSKKVRSSMGEFEIDVPQDRESQFEPKVIKKRQKDISEIERYFVFGNATFIDSLIPVKPSGQSIIMSFNPLFLSSLNTDNQYFEDPASPT